MNAEAQIATADAADRHRTLTAWAALSMSLMFITRAAMHIVGPALEANLDYFVVGFALLAVGLAVRVAFWKISNLRTMPKSERNTYFSPDGFVNDLFNRAQRVSWTVTFLVLMLLDAVVFDKNSTGYLTTLPVVFYLQLIIGMMLGVMASVFLILNRADGADDGEDGNS